MVQKLGARHMVNQITVMLEFLTLPKIDDHNMTIN